MGAGGPAQVEGASRPSSRRVDVLVIQAPPGIPDT